MDFLAPYKSDQTTTVVLIEREVAHQLRSLQKDIRALSASAVRSMLTNQGFRRIMIGDNDALNSLSGSDAGIVMPDEDITRAVSEKYFCGRSVRWIQTFLRWNAGNVTTQHPVIPDAVLSVIGMRRAYQAASKSSDWWRRVGAALYDGSLLLLTAYNHHLPTEMEPYFAGDVRAVFSKGVNQDLLTAIHAEAALIAEAARIGLSVEGTTLFVVTFPCPSCAKLLAASGIAEIIYHEGYSMLDGQTVLEAGGVRITHLE